MATRILIVTNGNDTSDRNSAVVVSDFLRPLKVAAGYSSSDCDADSRTLIFSV
jgi:hypothetical protein